MPSPERPNALVVAFCEKLIEQKTRAGLSYRELGRRAKFSHAHMVRADRGTELPSWDVAEAYLIACGITSPRTLIVFQTLWENAARSLGAEGQASRSASRKAAAASLRNIRTPEEFGELLRRLAQRGSPVRKDTKPLSLRDLAKLSGFSKSTLADWFAGNRVPSHHKLQSLAVTIEATQTEIAELLAARRRIELHRLNPRDAELVIENIELGGDRKVVRQLTEVLLQSADRRDQADAVRRVGAERVIGSYSTPASTTARHRAAPTPDQLGKEQAELEKLAQRVAQILAETQARRSQDAAALPLYSLSAARKLKATKPVGGATRVTASSRARPARARTSAWKGTRLTTAASAI